MAITANMNGAQLQNDFNQKVEAIKADIRMALHMAGFEFERDSRKQPGGHELGFYNDQTAHLRNSIDFYVYEDGKCIDEGSECEFKDENKGKIFDVIAKGFTLIGMAGKEYASQVEARGYNVITQQGEKMQDTAITFLNEIKSAHG